MDVKKLWQGAKQVLAVILGGVISVDPHFCSWRHVAGMDGRRTARTAKAEGAPGGLSGRTFGEHRRRILA